MGDTSRSRRTFVAVMSPVTGSLTARQVNLLPSQVFWPIIKLEKPSPEASTADQ